MLVGCPTLIPPLAPAALRATFLAFHGFPLSQCFSGDISRVILIFLERCVLRTCSADTRRIYFCLVHVFVIPLRPQVSIFVSGPGTTRVLNVHPDCVLAVFPADTPLPTPSRLEWLKTCGESETLLLRLRRCASGGCLQLLRDWKRYPDVPLVLFNEALLAARAVVQASRFSSACWPLAMGIIAHVHKLHAVPQICISLPSVGVSVFPADPPFTPRSVSDCGDHGFTPPTPSRRTPSSRLTTSAAMSPRVRPRGAASRRRPRPLASRESLDQQWSQCQSQQWQTTPRISPPVPRPLGSMRGEQRERHEEQGQGGRREQQRRQQRQQARATTPGGSSPPTQQEESRTLPERHSLPQSPSGAGSPEPS